MIVLSGNISKNFTQAEYHKGNATVYFKAGTMTFVRCLQDFRNWIKTPMYVISWYRLPAENKAIGGISSSNHLNGCACDFKLSFPITKSLFIKYAKQWATICKQNGCVGEAGLYNWGVHFGMQNGTQAKANGHKFVHWDTRSGRQVNNPFPELRGL